MRVEGIKCNNIATKSDELLEIIEKGLLYMLTHNKNIFDDGTGHGYRDGDVIYYEWADGGRGEKNDDGSTEGYPPVMHLGSSDLKITKSDFREKLTEAIQKGYVA